MDSVLNVPQPGAVVTFRQQDVYLGDADLILRLTSIADGRPVHHQLEWVSVEGMALNVDGSDRGYRSALVRLAALGLSQSARINAAASSSSTLNEPR